MRQVTRASSGQSQALLSCLIIAVCAALIIQSGHIQGVKAQPGREPGEVNSRQPGNGAYENSTGTERRLRKVIWKCIPTGNGTTGHRVPRSVFHVRWNPNEKFIVESRENPAINSSKLAPHPRLKVSKNTKLTLSPKLYLCHDKHSELCHNKTQQFRQRIVRAFEKAMVESVNESQANHYNVDYKPVFGDSFEEQYYPSTCLVMEAGVRVLRRKDAPFNKLPFGRLFPRQKLFRNVKDIKTCAIVSSAGSLAGSKLGRFIGE